MSYRDESEMVQVVLLLKNWIVRGFSKDVLTKKQHLAKRLANATDALRHDSTLAFDMFWFS